MPSTSDQIDDPLIVTAALEIRSILRSVQRHKALVRMYMRGNSDQSIMTTVLGFDDAAGRVIVDSSADTALNQRLVNASGVNFDTQVDRISISFAGGGLQNCTHDGLPALSFPLPQALKRVQRREAYRVEIPVGEPAICNLSLAEPGQAPRRVDIRLKDISTGGIALVDSENEIPHESGKIFRNARLTLPEVGDVTVDLDVLRVHTVILPNKKEIVELACRFVKPSNATSMLVQTYIGRLERRLIAKRRGY